MRQDDERPATVEGADHGPEHAGLATEDGPQSGNAAIDQGLEAPSLRGMIRRWVERASVLGWVISVALHALLLLLAASILLDRPGGTGRSAGEVELAIVTQQELSQMQREALSAPSTQMQVEAELDPAPEVSFDAPAPESLEPSVDAGALLGGAGAAQGDDMSLSGGAGGSASFFGVEARGSRFAYVVDVSGSMGGPKIAALRRELATSIDRLSAHASFFVAFFSHEMDILGGRRQWTRAQSQRKRTALQEIGAIQASGATNPIPALKAAFSLQPTPDAIYLMTDGQFSRSVVDEVARMNSVHIEPVPIHTISFVSREAEAQLRQIANESGGTYTHIEGPGS